MTSSYRISRSLRAHARPRTPDQGVPPWPRPRSARVASLAQETECVLLDEPFNNLDMARSVQMMRTIRDAADRLGRTFVVVLHDINFAAAYADSIIAMKDGRIEAQGSPGEIVTGELLSGIFDTDVRVLDGPKGPIAVYS